MMSTMRAILAATLITSAVACAESTGPIAAAPAQTQPLPPIPPFPALTRPATTYRGPDDLYYPDRPPGYEMHSRFVLYDDGTFALQLIGVQGFLEYKGRYTRADSLITFDWDGWSVAGAWGATATLRGDDLIVKYNTIMLLTDFVDGTYVRVQ